MIEEEEEEKESQPAVGMGGRLLERTQHERSRC